MALVEIKDITDQMDDITLIAYVERANILTASNGSQYLAIYFSDKTGRIEGRKWSVDAEDKERLVNGQIYEVQAKVNSYKNVIQLKVGRYQHLTEEDMQKRGIRTDEFMASAPFDRETEFNSLIDEIDQMENDTYRSITKTILKRYENEFKNYPAAINIHHNLVGGLLWHSKSLFNNIVAIQDNYMMFSNIDWELAQCGAILHDIGKIREMNGLIADDYTLSGKLLGHISMGSEIVGFVAKDLGIENEDVIKLQHVILSSHGKREFGSPQEPNLIEGVIISTFDNLDARIYHINSELEKVPEGKWTQRVVSEEGKMFYRHFNSKKSQN